MDRDEKGKFLKGHKSLSPGRPKGSETKERKRIRAMISELILGCFENIEQDIQQMPPKERVSALLGLMEYCVPKLQRVEYKEEQDKTIDKVDIVVHHTSAKSLQESMINSSKQADNGDEH